MITAIGLTLAASVPLAHAQTGKRANRVVIQVSDRDATKWNLALDNARNVQSELGRDNVEVEIIAYGPGLDMLKADSVVANRVDDMVPKIGYVKAGVVELMQKQQQGWAYIRP